MIEISAAFPANICAMNSAGIDEQADDYSQIEVELDGSILSDPARSQFPGTHLGFTEQRCIVPGCNVVKVVNLQPASSRGANRQANDDWADFGLGERPFIATVTE